jgi:putative hemolysin
MPELISTNMPQVDMPNPASVYCESQGNRLEIRAAADGSQSGVCIFPDGQECDEWAYFRGECLPANQDTSSSTPIVEGEATVAAPTGIPTPLPIDPADYQGWWTYTNPNHNFSLMLPEDWSVDENAANYPLLNGHLLNLGPENGSGSESIRITFRRSGEDTVLWPTGVGQGEFVPLGTLEVAGQPAARLLLVCPTGEVTAIWYHQDEGLPNLARGDLEFGFIFNATPSHCAAGYSLSGKTLRVGEMVIASLKVP